MKFFKILFFIPLLANAMNLETKVGQLLLVNFQGEEVNEEAELLVRDLSVGGILYYKWANGLHSPEQVRSLSQGLQQLAKENGPPLLIAIDQEGGRVSRLTEGFTKFPSNREVGRTGNPELAKECALGIGKELKAVGINLNLAPVVDIDSNPKNPVIGNRSFSESKEEVFLFAKEALEGYRQAGILACLKHFPGHGDVEVDSHLDLPIVRKSKEELYELELFPFAQLAGSADCIMTAHLLVPALDPQNCATLSRDILEGVLREEMGFEGVILSDSLLMQGLLNNASSLEEAAIRAINAGCDMLILGGRQLIEGRFSVALTAADIQQLHQSLVDAVRSGLISEERIDQSVQRILSLKERAL